MSRHSFQKGVQLICAKVKALVFWWITGDLAVNAHLDAQDQNAKTVDLAFIFIFPNGQKSRQKSNHRRWYGRCLHCRLVYAVYHSKCVSANCPNIWTCRSWRMPAFFSMQKRRQLHKFEKRLHLQMQWWLDGQKLWQWDSFSTHACNEIKYRNLPICSGPCQNVYRSCSKWKKQKQCELMRSHTDFFDKNCAVSCDQCVFDNSTSRNQYKFM